ncbi:MULTISPECIES: GNAT family N-acetyltransferase [unclassified Pantoea]|uniref:GNAT family N-acetyltransferase n=1 Tax=unclassified Pantoea TaxID=2630326 RepID=UPI000534F17B|nr:MULTISPECIES: GNAT family N-acetyltransferase [unclassified Pantoea]MDU6387913.1 GNAT family N-acetyltransferase [Pantoea sp.]
MIQVMREDADHPDARWLLDQLSDTLTQLTGSSGRIRFDAAEMAMPGRCFAVARNAQRQPVGCGAFRPLQPDVAELKRMFALPGSQGAGAALLHFLEQQARLEGYRELWLETRRVNARALAFYARHGFQPIAAFGPYAAMPQAQCLGKRLDGQGSA